MIWADGTHITPNCALVQPAAGVRWGVAEGSQTVKNPIPGEPVAESESAEPVSTLSSILGH